MAPPILPYLAGLTLRHQPEVEIELLDANRQTVDATAIQADLVGISVITTGADWAYQVADRLRGLGIPVLLGGIHVSALPDEATKHADSVVIGEAESVMEEVLQDAEAGRLKPVYRGGKSDLSDIPHSRRDLLKPRYMVDSLFTMRGCVQNCSFCTVNRFFGSTMRFRPISEVLAEVDGSVGRFYYNVDDNAWGLDIDRAIRLFKGLAGLDKRKWFGHGDLGTVQGERGDELLASAARAGLTSIMLGFESMDETRLETLNASTKQGRDRVAAIERIKSHGIDPVLFIIIDTRTCDLSEFDRILELSERLLVTIHPVFLLPLPGSALFADPGLVTVPDISWQDFDGGKVIFPNRDPALTPKILEEAYYEMLPKLFSYGRIFRRVFSISRSGFPSSHAMSLMLQIALHRAYIDEARRWKMDDASQNAL